MPRLGLRGLLIAPVAFASLGHPGFSSRFSHVQIRFRWFCSLTDSHFQIDWFSHVQIDFCHSCWQCKNWDESLKSLLDASHGAMAMAIIYMAQNLFSAHPTVWPNSTVWRVAVMLPTLAVGAGISSAPPRGYIEANVGYLGTHQPLPDSVPVDAYTTHCWSQTMEQVARSLEHGTCSVGRLEGVLFLVRDGPEPLTSATSEYPDPAEEPQPRPKEPAPQPNLNAAENNRLDQKLTLLTKEVSRRVGGQRTPNTIWACSVHHLLALGSPSPPRARVRAAPRGQACQAAEVEWEPGSPEKWTSRGGSSSVLFWSGWRLAETLSRMIRWNRFMDQFRKLPA